MRNVQILLADDDEDDRNFFREALSAADIVAELKTVVDGIELTDYLTTIKNPPPPDIIFLDINMPFKNGKTCLREIRNNQNYNSIPVVMFSTSSHDKDVEDTYSEGANLYIYKDEFFEDEIKMLKILFSPGGKKQLNSTSREDFILKIGN